MINPINSITNIIGTKLYLPEHSIFKIGRYAGLNGIIMIINNFLLFQMINICSI